MARMHVEDSRGRLPICCCRWTQHGNDGPASLQKVTGEGIRSVTPTAGSLQDWATVAVGEVFGSEARIHSCSRQCL